MLYPFLHDFATCTGTFNEEQTQIRGYLRWIPDVPRKSGELYLCLPARVDVAKAKERANKNAVV